MRKILAVTLFMLATLAWAVAQQPGTAPGVSGQSTPPGSPAPGATQTQPSTPGGASQAAPQGQPSDAPVTEGCLGGSSPNYTITDKSGTTYKLKLPANANASSLSSHVGESVLVMGDVNGKGQTGGSIDVQRMAKGTGTCPGNAQSPQKQ